MYAALLLYTLPALAIPLLPPDLGPQRLFEELKTLPNQWTKVDGNTSGSNLEVLIGLKQSNPQGLQQRLLEVSDPSHTDYGKWLSKEQIDAYVAPPAANVALIKTWLALYGINEADITSPTSDWLAFTAPVSTMENMLGTQYDFYLHPSRPEAIPRTLQYSVPLALHDLIDLITPTTAFYQKLSPSVSNGHEGVKAKRQSCDGSVIYPQCIYDLYNVNYTSQGSQTIATTELIGVGAVHSDYKQFGQTYAIAGNGLTDFADISVDGGSNPGAGTNDTLEGNLDTQYIGGVAQYYAQNQYLALGGDADDYFADEVANLASYLTSTSSPPSVVSTSYGGEERQFSNSYLTRVCNEFMKAGSAGISIFFSSGDYGVGGTNETSCPNGFYALWPATCPFTTAVGGTMFSGGQEVAVATNFGDGTPFRSGGGFSYAFSTPSYQASQVSNYISNLNGDDNNLYNQNGRGYPDVALASVNYRIINQGQNEGVDGTSASSPTWAALVSLVNDYRYQNGLSQLGFLNPLLYSANTQSADSLHDITSGSNPYCGYAGFPATTGWDPVTGLGSINFANFLGQNS